MAEPIFSDVDADDDLPRTLRREREAQERRARGLEFPDDATSGPVNGAAQAAPSNPYQQEAYDYDAFEPAPANVTQLNIPFFHLMLFFLKAVVAAIPALMLLVVIMWGLGEILTQTFPELIKMQVLIRMPN